MAIDITRRVLTKFEADSTGVERAMERMKTRTSAFSKGLSDLGEDLNSTMDKLGKMNQAWEGASKVIDITRDSMKAYGDEMRLMTAAGTVNINELSEAYGGLINRHELLELAAKSQHGAFKLNQDQLDTLGKATVALSHQGFDLTETFNKLRDAAIRGKAEGLDDLGLSIKDGATKAETLNRIMAELNKKIGDSTGYTSTAADEVQQYTVMFENLKNEMLIVNGQYTVMTTKAVETGETLKKYLPVFDAMAAFQRGFRNGNGRSMFGNGFGDDEASAIKQYELTLGPISVSRSGARNDNSGDEFRKHLADMVAKDLTDALVENLSRIPDQPKLYGSLAEIDPGLSDAHFAAMQKSLEDLRGKFVEAGTRETRYAAFNNNQNSSWMTRTFGTPEEFNALGKAFNAFTDSVGAGFEAIVTGSESGGKAFKNMLASGLLATGKSEAVEAIKDEAWALGSLAGQDYKGFALYQMAAVKHAAAAVAAGVGASALGAGGGSPSGASGGSSSGGSSGHGSSSGSRETVTNYIIIGDNQADDSPRMRQRSAQRVVDLAASRTSAGGAM
jgi:uncharacterized protein YoxC